MILQQDFELTLTEKKVKNHQIIALHLMIALAVIGAGAVFYTFTQEVKAYGLALIIGGLMLLILGIIKNRWLIKSRINRPLRMVELAVSGSILYYVVTNNMTPAIFMFGALCAAILFAFFYERESNTGLVIRINKDGLKLPLTLRKHIEWKDIESIILKFGVLTINASNNRMFQWTVGEIKFDITSFEVYCKEQIAKGKELRDKNDW